MAFNQRMAFEVDAATGNDANGGGFDDTTGVPGTNRAWGAGQAVTAFTDLVSVGAGSTATSAAFPFSAASVGNVLNITGGTNFTVGRYQILSVSGVTATFDRAITTGIGALGTGNLGGALLTIQAGINAAFISTGAVADCRVYIKAGAYTGTVALVTAGSVAVVGYRCRVIGYSATHDDTPVGASRPSYAVGSGAGVPGATVSTSGFHFENMIFDGVATSGTKGTIGFNATAQYSHAYNCKCLNFSAEGVKLINDSIFAWGEVTLCAGTTGSVNLGGIESGVLFSWIHKNTKSGINIATAGSVVIGNLITNNSGASSDGITNAGFSSTILGNTVYGNGRDGLRATQVYSANLGVTMWRNNIFAKNAGRGINLTSAPPLPSVFWQADYNAFYLNTTADRTNISAGLHDASVSVNPFVSSDADLAAETAPDWSLNAVASAGASLRAAGFPGAAAGLTTPLGFASIGAYQASGVTDNSGGFGGLVTGSPLVVSYW